MTMAILAMYFMQKQRTATAVSTETVEADSELGAPKFLPFVQQVRAQAGLALMMDICSPILLAGSVGIPKR